MAYTGVAKAKVMAIARKGFIGSIHQKGIATLLGWWRWGNDLVRNTSTKQGVSQSMDTRFRHPRERWDPV